MASKEVHAINTSYHSRYAKKKVAQQPDGMPQGKHMAGFKGAKVDAVCLCGRCHPNAKR